MATWIVGGVLTLIVGAVVVKMIKDKKQGKGSCTCGGDCSKCHAACSSQPK
ncbi:MAG: FeoB-associated Cys-rich membrane protein [Clostridia bacterium]|nr:FeoB-associated Cys-rich membrane protein [Clostridia bacterium]